MNYAYYTLALGEDLQRLAVRLLGDRSRWRELAELNGLEYPYIANDPTPYRSHGLKVLGPGDKLYYPGSTSAPPYNPDQAEMQTYGEDLLLAGHWPCGGYLQFAESELQMTSGLPNLADALERRLNTPLGGLPAHPFSYGQAFKDYLGGAGDATMLEYVRLEAGRTIAQDTRVAAVPVLDARLENQAVFIHAQVTPITPGVLTLDVEAQ